MNALPNVNALPNDQPIAFHNDQFVLADRLVVRPQDMGFMLGVTVAEQLRTFAGELGDVDAHVVRLTSSLEIVGVEVDVAKIIDAARKVAAHNYELLPDGHDLGVTVFVTPGLYPTYCPDGVSRPTIGIHTYPLPFGLWVNKYEIGQVCDFVSIPQVSADSWPRHLKCRSRMHYYLADREARVKAPTSRAILLDDDGNVNEASTANVLAYFASEGLVSPPLESVLPGISLQRTLRLAESLEIPVVLRHMSPDECKSADEVLLTSTPFCLLPVSRLGDREFKSRDCFAKLIATWNAEVGFDLVRPAQMCAS